MGNSNVVCKRYVIHVVAPLSFDSFCVVCCCSVYSLHFGTEYTLEANLKDLSTICISTLYANKRQLRKANIHRMQLVIQLEYYLQ